MIQSKYGVAIYLVILQLVFGVLNSTAQEKQISGVITNNRGELLEAVTVKVVGSNFATTSNSKGEFSIRTEGSSPSLSFAYLGYEPQTIKVDSNQKLKIVMKESSSILDDVVVIGFGEQKRADLTGAIGTVNMADLEKAPVKSFDEALAGRVAGVQVTSSEGKPGSNIDIVIRGVGSITQNVGPLFVIDGMPIENPNDGTSAVNPLNALDPADISSIDILKDASATAIYGARGGNGVVIITTKRGALSAPKIRFNTYYGLQNSTKRQRVLSPYEFVKLQQEIDPARTSQLYLQYGYIDMEDYKLLDGINWEDQVMRVAPMNNNHLSLTGGTVQTKYSASLSHINQAGILLNSGFKRTQGRLTLDQQVSSRLKIGLDASYSGNKNYGTPTSSSSSSHEANLLFSVWAYRPVSLTTTNLLELGLDPDIEQAAESRFNPIMTTKNELRENFGSSFIANGFGEFEFTKNFKYKLSGTYSKGLRRYDTYNGSNSRTGHEYTNYQLNGSRTYFESDRWYVSNQFTFTKTFDRKHYLNAMLGFTAERSSGLNFGATAIRLQNETSGLSGLDEGEPNNISSGTTAASMASFMGRAIYSYDSRYLLTVTGRYDGSSRFLNKNVYGFFPSLATAWRINNEKFMKRYTWLSNAKLRASWGLTGNNAVGNYAAYAALLSQNNTGYTLDGKVIRGVVPTSLGNSTLKWESSEQIDLGLDLGFFQERLTFVMDLYRKNSHDLLMNAGMSPSSGYSTVIKNIGKIRNQGIEITVGFVPFKNKFGWTSDFNISFNNNKVLELVDNQYSRLTSMGWGDDWKSVPAYVAQIGKPVSQFYGVLWDGVYQYDDFDFDGSKYVLKPILSTNGTSSVQPGHIKYKDLNGDRIINDDDKVVIGNPLPKHYGGWSNNFTYHNFDLNVFMQWSYGNQVLNANRLIMESGYKYNTNQFASYADRWSPDNQEGVLPVARGALYKTYSDRVVEDGSFLRLKTISFGYNFTPELLKKISISQARLYFSAQNLYTWSNYSGYDPEVSVRNSALTTGFDYSAYPRAKTYTLGLNLTF